MDCYRDSMPIVHDREALRARLSEDGYLFFRRLVDPESVVDLRADVLLALDRSGWLEDGTDPLDARPGPLIRNEGSEPFWEGYANIQKLQRFHRAAHDARLGAMLRALIDDDLVVHPRKIARVSFPHSGFATPPHQDFRYIQGTTDVFTVWMPLGPCPVELGGLRILRGTQHSGLLPTITAPGAGGLAVETDDDDPDWVSDDYEAGDALVFHSLTVHGAVPNVTDRLRLSVDYRYQSAAEPLTKETLAPHFYPDIPGWPELTGDWDDHSPIASPDDPMLSEFRVPPNREDLELSPSRFVRVPA